MQNDRLKTLAVLFLVFGLAFFPVSCAGSGASSGPAPTISPALRDLHVTGKLIYIRYGPDGNQLVQLDLSDGRTRSLFQAPSKSWLASAEVSPDGKQILLAYSPPPPSAQLQFSFTDLYLMPADGSSPLKPLLVRFNDNESYFTPAWSPDGKTIYYSHNVPSSAVPSGVETRIERAVPGSEPQPLIENAMWPRLSRDGTKLVYHSLKHEDAQNELYWANADGSNPQRVIVSSQPVIVDAHLFSPDSKSVYVSMPDQQPQSERTPASPWTSLVISLGVQPVSAHSLPSDWFRIDLPSGQPGHGVPQQVSHMQDSGMYAAFSPDGQWLAIISQKGLFVMKPDGSRLTQLGEGPGVGSVNWVP